MKRLALAALLAGLAAPAPADAPLAAACERLAAPGAMDDFETMIGRAEGCLSLSEAARCDRPRRWREGPAIGADLRGLSEDARRSVARTVTAFAADFRAATGLEARVDGSAPDVLLLFSLDAARALSHGGGPMHGLDFEAFSSASGGDVPCFVRVSASTEAILGATALIAVEDADAREACVVEELFNATGIGADPEGAASVLDVYPADERDGVAVLPATLAAMLRLYYRVPEAAMTTPASTRAAVEGICAEAG